MKRVLIITDLSFPSGSAMASRLLSFCHIFDELHYSVHVITAKYEGDDYKKGNIYENGYYSFEIVGSNRSYGLQSFLGNENLSRRVDNYLNENDVEFVFMTSLNMNFKKVFDVCKKHNKKIILEQCEWYDSSSFRFKDLDPRFKNFNKNISERFKKVDGVISISRLLNDYYLNSGLRSIRIPSILDISNKPYSINTQNKKIKLVYTGNASKSKELLKPIMEAIYEYKDSFELDIYGISEERLLDNIDNDINLYEQLKDNVKCYGFVSQEEIESIIMKADYQIFIRPDRKSSNAGFPTKLSESLAVGTPVICNETGDIGLYLSDGYNSFISLGITKDSLKHVFNRLLRLEKSQYQSIRENARKTAEKNFDYKIYIEDVKKLIEEL